MKELVYRNLRARRRWHNCQKPLDKTYPNGLTHNLQTATRRTENEAFYHCVTEGSTTDHWIWKEAKNCTSPIVPRPPVRQPDRS
jgi:hypothetical protein